MVHPQKSPKRAPAGRYDEGMARQLLVVDDDLQILKLFSQILTRGGYCVRTEDSSQRAMQALDTGAPLDLVVLDLSMPEPDGFEILKAFRAKSPELKILVTSGFIGGVLLEAAALMGASATLNKTDAPELLLKTVDSLLQS
jgi:CheY-like chemotaxis protein